MRALRYTDFDLRIERDGSGYTARVLESPAGEAAGTFTLPFSNDKIENLILKIGRRLGGSVRRQHTDEMTAARELGGSLFEALFTGGVRDCYTRSLDHISRTDGVGLRLRLRLQDVPELADLPWELLLDNSRGRFLAQSAQTPVVRYMEMSEGVRPLGLALPLRILVMISSPVDEQQLNVQQERERLEAALEPLRLQGKVEVTWLEDATLSNLLRHLRNETYHIFHFVGHGAFDPKREVGLLVLEGEGERAFPADADRIGAFLHDHPSLRLAVLNSCEGARNSRSDPFAGVAANLVRQGIPAVVAMQFEISDDAAITFAGEFYSALAEGFSVDAAVAEARKAIFAQPNDVEWATPVLYMRSPNGVLFKLEDQETASKREAAARERLEAKQREQAAIAARRDQARRDREEQETAAAARRVQEAEAAREAQRKLEAEAEAEARAAEAARQAKTPQRPGTGNDSRVPSYVAAGAVIVGLILLIIVWATPDPPPSSYPLTLSLTPSTSNVLIGQTAQLNASMDYSDGSTLSSYPSWTTSNEAVATVSYTGLVTGVAPGDAEIAATSDGLTARASITVFTDGAFDIPALRANVAQVRFFESPRTLFGKDERVYRTSFASAMTRYVGIEIGLRHPAPAVALQATIPCTFYNPDGSVKARLSVDARIEVGETESWQSAGWGAERAGSWSAGRYRVTCVAGGKTIGRGTFTVTGGVPDPPRDVRYDIPALKAHVRRIRFFEGPNDAPAIDQRVYITRFNRQTTRFIFLQLDIAFPAPGRVLEATVSCNYFRDGTEYAALGLMTWRIEPDWTIAEHRQGWGWPTAGNWPTGIYRASCTSDGREMANATFEVY